jgi:drug/metabolite transporter (DMT)-like permease
VRFRAPFTSRAFGVLFASVAVWNIAIQNSSATQASLLVNLAPLWVGIISTYSLTRNQQLIFGLERQWHYLEWLCWSVNFS